jgi:hypothetical protein
VATDTDDDGCTVADDNQRPAAVQVVARPDKAPKSWRFPTKNVSAGGGGERATAKDATGQTQATEGLDVPITLSRPTSSA